MLPDLVSSAESSPRLQPFTVPRLAPFLTRPSGRTGGEFGYVEGLPFLSPTSGLFGRLLRFLSHSLGNLFYALLWGVASYFEDPSDCRATAKAVDHHALDSELLRSESEMLPTLELTRSSVERRPVSQLCTGVSDLDEL